MREALADGYILATEATEFLQWVFLRGLCDLCGYTLGSSRGTLFRKLVGIYDRAKA